MKTLLLCILILLLVPFTNTLAAKKISPDGKPVENHTHVVPKQVQKDIALFRAVKASKREDVKTMLEAGANPNTMYHGVSSLSIAGYNGRLAIVRLLIKHGADVNKRGANQTTALMHSAVGGNIATVNFLIEKGANINAQDSIGFSPLMIASVSGMPKMAKNLLSHGADSSLKNNKGEDAYAIAKRNGHKKTADLLKAWQEKKKQ